MRLALAAVLTVLAAVEPAAAQTPTQDAEPTSAPDVAAASQPGSQPGDAYAPADPSSAPAEPTSMPSGQTSSSVPPDPMAPAPLEETFVPILAPAGEAPPIPFPVVLSVGSVLNPRLTVGDFRLEPHMRIRVRGNWVQRDANLYTVGRTNGFNMDQARVGLSGGYRRSVRFVLNLEAAASQRDGLNQLIGQRVPQLRDAYFTFAPWDFLQFTAGQFIPPANREVLNSFGAAVGAGRTGTPQLLPEASVASRGVRAGDGYQVNGMDPDRDLGLRLHGDIKPFRFMTGTYALAVVNGNGQNQVGNDNNHPTLWARTTFGVHSLPVLTLLDVGLSAYYGRNTDLGALPNEFSDEQMGSAVDAVVQVFGFQVMGQLQWDRTRHLTTNSAQELAVGGFLQVAWRDFYGFSPVGRAAYYQASSGLPQFTVAEFTAGMRYDTPGLPFTGQVAFVHPEETGWGVYDLGEGNTTRVSEIPSSARIPAPVRSRLGLGNWMVDRQDGQSLTNDRVEAVVQMAF